jgi:2,4-dienoyl-CoA reductase-like NADH-dependent reductase (Old Yellow Enzyme family)
VASRITWRAEDEHKALAADSSSDIKLNHRLAMAPMTRSRSTAQGVPTDLNAEYHAQRASMALIISEGTQPSDDGWGYLFTPGIYTDDQVIGWRKVTEAVRSAGGQMVIQLMHVGASLIRRIRRTAGSRLRRPPSSPTRRFSLLRGCRTFPSRARSGLMRFRRSFRSSGTPPPPRERPALKA